MSQQTKEIVATEKFETNIACLTCKHEFNIIRMSHISTSAFLET